jgi:hypothetical protein
MLFEYYYKELVMYKIRFTFLIVSDITTKIKKYKQNSKHCRLVTYLLSL